MGKVDELIKTLEENETISKELKIFIGTAVEHKGYIEMIYQTQTLAWYDLAKYAQQTYPKVFK